ncbi:hypothetical protein [Streptomyces sp. AD55]|uniref:hypothetical protein n=1 Tax=Streptomyces sp. AD55 TaxID=3242895 RepID=UPI0035290039
MPGHAERLPGDSGPLLAVVELVTPHGVDILIYGPGPRFEIIDVSFIPAALVDDES